jgi:hypothetical protein
MKMPLTEAQFSGLVAQSDLQLTPEQEKNLFEAFGYVEHMAARMRQPLPRQAALSLIFKPKSPR